MVTSSLQKPRKVPEKRKRVAAEDVIAVVPGGNVGEGLAFRACYSHHFAPVSLNYKLDSRTIEEKLSEIKRSKAADHA